MVGVDEWQLEKEVEKEKLCKWHMSFVTWAAICKSREKPGKKCKFQMISDFGWQWRLDFRDILQRS